MHYLFLSMDYEHDADMRHYYWCWNFRDDVYGLHSDISRLQTNGLCSEDIRQHIYHRIDDADAVLVIAGEWSNDPEEMKKANGNVYTAEEIGELNWQHVGLRYAVQQKKPMRGLKLFKHCEIPLPLKRARGLRWRTVSGKILLSQIEDLFPKPPEISGAEAVADVKESPDPDADAEPEFAGPMWALELSLERDWLW